MRNKKIEKRRHLKCNHNGSKNKNLLNNRRIDRLQLNQLNKLRLKDSIMQHLLRNKEKQILKKLRKMKKQELRLKSQLPLSIREKLKLNNLEHLELRLSLLLNQTSEKLKSWLINLLRKWMNPENTDKNFLTKRESWLPRSHNRRLCMKSSYRIQRKQRSNLILLKSYW